jgi:hypothetical protein
MRLSIAWRVSLVGALMAIVVPFASVSSAMAATDDSDTATWVDEPVPGTPLTVKRPARWVVQDRTVTKQFGSATAADVHLMISNPDNGDNAVVNRFVGPDAEWYSSFGEWKQVAKASAASSKGKLLATGRRTIGGMPAYWDLETYKDPAAGVPIYFSEFEVRTGSDNVVTVAITIAKDVPHARRLVTNLIENVEARDVTPAGL